MIIKQKATVEVLVIVPTFKVSAVVNRIAPTKATICPVLLKSVWYFLKVFIDINLLNNKNTMMRAEEFNFRVPLRVPFLSFPGLD